MTIFLFYLNFYINCVILILTDFVIERGNHMKKYTKTKSNVIEFPKTMFQNYKILKQRPISLQKELDALDLQIARAVNSGSIEKIRILKEQRDNKKRSLDRANKRFLRI